MKLKNIFKRRNTFKVGEYAKAWVWAKSTEARIYVKIIGIDEKFCQVRYLDQQKKKFLMQCDPSFCLPELIPFRDLCHLAYDEQVEAALIDRKKSC